MVSRVSIKTEFPFPGKGLLSDQVETTSLNLCKPIFILYDFQMARMASGGCVCRQGPILQQAVFGAEQYGQTASLDNHALSRSRRSRKRTGQEPFPALLNMAPNLWGWQSISSQSSKAGNWRPQERNCPKCRSKPAGDSRTGCASAVPGLPIFGGCADS